MEKENLVEDKNNLQFPSKKRRTLLIIIIVVIVLIAVALILIFTLRKNSDNSPDEIIFNKIVRNDSQIDLIPKSGKYEYVFIFMHGLFGRPEIYVDTFNKKDGPTLIILKLFCLVQKMYLCLE